MKPLLCPECVAEGERSEVERGGTHRTLMFSRQYWDEDGRFHHHDPNIVSTSFRCSRGHRWKVETKHECETCKLIEQEATIT